MLFLILVSFSVHGQSINLNDISKKWNEELPENYDSITKLRSTSIENNHFVFNFLIEATQFEFDTALPMVRSQILKTVCSKPREKNLLTINNAHLVYRYENTKGQVLGEFMIRPEHCRK